MAAQTQSLIEQINQTGLQGVNSEALANITGKWNNLISSNSAAASQVTAMLNGISTIMNNQNIAPGKAGELINAEVSLLNQSLTVMDAISGGSTPPQVAGTGAALASGSTTPQLPPAKPGPPP
jgi:hypothetical protein